MAGPGEVDFARAVAGCDHGALAAALVHLTGDRCWVDGYAAYLAATRRPDGMSHEERASGREFVREAVQALSRRIPAEGVALPDPDDELLTEMMAAVTGLPVLPGYLPLLRDALGLSAGGHAPPRVAGTERGPHVVVVGAGMSGLFMARRLAAGGFPFTVLEKNSDIGGVWLDNRYPSAGLDTHPYLYSWSDTNDFEWARADAQRADILDYIRLSSDLEGALRGRVRFGTEVQAVEWCEEPPHWRLRLRQRDDLPAELRADVVVTAVGALSQPRIPDLPGLDRFAGRSFHTARWPADYEPDGCRIALIGNGSSGVQLGPVLADRAAHLIAFQRSPHWIHPRLPHEMGPITDLEQELRRSVPFYRGWHRFILFALADSIHDALVVDPEYPGPGPNERNDQLRAELEAYLRKEVGDDERLVAALTPDYPPYGKRMVIDSGWYRTLARPDVSLVTDPISEVTVSGVRTDQDLYEVDTIIFATGFHGTTFLWPLEVRGPSGSAYVDECGGWESVRAYLGVAYPGLPNFFTISGPNSGVGHGGSTTFTSERQASYIMKCLEWLRECGDAHTIECRPEACDRYNEELETALAGMVWSHRGLTSRYRSSSGRIVMNHPWRHVEYWNRTADVDHRAFHIQHSGRWSTHSTIHG